MAQGQKQARFVEGNLFRHVVVMSLTGSIGLMAIFIVDLINMVYVSWLKDPILTAAVGYSGAVTFFAMAFGIGLSIGTSALVSRAIGQGDMALARERATNGLILGVGFGTVFAALIFALLPTIVAGLGATGRTAEETIWFLQLYTASQPLMMVGIVGSAILRSYGEARRAMMVTVWGAVCLAVVNPILIFPMGLDLAGVAWGAAISRVVMVWVALAPMLRRIGAFAPVTWRGLQVEMRPMFFISGPAIMTQMATPIGLALVTRMVARYGEDAVAGMAITGRLTPVAFAMIFALAGSLGPIFGQNLGAGRMDRVKETFRAAILFTGLVIATVSLVLFVLRAPLADLFHAEGVTRELVYLFCGPLSLLFFFNGLIFVANAACNNLGAAMQSTWVNWARHTLGTLPFAYWGALYWGAAGVLIGQAVGGIFFGLLAIWLAWRIIAKRASYK